MSINHMAYEEFLRIRKEVLHRLRYYPVFEVKPNDILRIGEGMTHAMPDACPFAIKSAKPGTWVSRIVRNRDYSSEKKLIKFEVLWARDSRVDYMNLPQPYQGQRISEGEPAYEDETHDEWIWFFIGDCQTTRHLGIMATFSLPPYNFFNYVLDQGQVFSDKSAENSIVWETIAYQARYQGVPAVAVPGGLVCDAGSSCTCKVYIRFANDDEDTDTEDNSTSESVEKDRPIIGVKVVFHGG